MVSLTTRAGLPIQLASATVFFGAIYAAVKTVDFPLVSLFAFDAPGSTSNPKAVLMCLALFSSPFLAFLSTIFAIRSLSKASAKSLAIAAWQS